MNEVSKVSKEKENNTESPELSEMHSDIKK
jgi:hypothetical protein